MNPKHLVALFRQERIDPVLICHLTTELAGRLGARRSRVFLSRETMDKQLDHHPDLDVEHYFLLKPALLQGEYRQDTPRSAMVVFTDTVWTGCSYRAAIKATQAGLFCVSFNKLRDRHLARALRSPHPIIRQHD